MPPTSPNCVESVENGRQSPECDQAEPTYSPQPGPQEAAPPQVASEVASSPVTSFWDWTIGPESTKAACQSRATFLCAMLGAVYGKVPYVGTMVGATCKVTYDNACQGYRR